MNSIGNENVKVIFDIFWKIGNFDLQNAHLSKLVSCTEPKSRITDRPSRKLRNINYTVIQNNKVISVCRTAFYSIHGITERRVRTVLDKQGPTGVTGTDGRGKNINSRVNQISPVLTILNLFQLYLVITVGPRVHT